MDKEVERLSLESSSDSVSQNDSEEQEENEDSDYWRICLKNIERHDVSAAEVASSERDGQAQEVFPSRPKSAFILHGEKLPLNVALYQDEQASFDISLSAFKRNQSFAALNDNDPQLHQMLTIALKDERDVVIAKIA